MGYYICKELHPWLYRISDPRGVHCYLLIGNEKALLFDTAFGLGDLAGEIREITDKPLTVVLGHGHWDHSCGAHLFPQAYLHAADLELYKMHNSAEYREMLFDWGGPLPEGFDREDFLNKGEGNLIELEVGTVFDLGGLQAKIVAMPGHSAGSVGVLVNKILLTSDALGGWLFLNESTSRSGYIAMLEQINQLDFTHFYGGHTNEPMPKSLIATHIQTAKNATMEETTPFPQEFRGLKGLQYAEDGVELVFSERTLNS